VLRHYASVLMATAPKKLDAKTLREQRSMLRGVSVRTNFHALSKRSFEQRRDVLLAAYESGAYLKDPENKGSPPNPLSDPSAMEGMMGMMKNNMAMIIPNTLIINWIGAFFSGYIISTRPFGEGWRAGDCGCADLLACSEAAVPDHAKVQEHAAVRRHDQGHGRAVDVEHQLVLSLHVWPAARLYVPPWERQW
jgi:hypothetical protein